MSILEWLPDSSRFLMLTKKLGLLFASQNKEPQNSDQEVLQLGVVIQDDGHLAHMG